MFYVTIQTIGIIHTRSYIYRICNGFGPLARFVSIIPANIREYQMGNIGFERLEKRSISLKWVNSHSFEIFAVFLE